MAGEESAFNQAGDLVSGTFSSAGRGVGLYGLLKTAALVPHMSEGTRKVIGGLAETITEYSTKVMPSAGADLALCVEAGLLLSAGYNIREKPIRALATAALGTAIPAITSRVNAAQSFFGSGNDYSISTMQIAGFAAASAAIGFAYNYIAKKVKSNE